ncbi:hypothetical protein [Caulobacter sp. DWR3-1-2]|uniref:hypothetical protein n=1 Tax=Caulobacter sp. DWR3-1-2 TaxID=2804647 RepID=UPI003CEAE135
MTHLLKRGMLALAMMAGLAFAAPAMAVDCTTSTTPNVAGTLANAQFEILQKLCAQSAKPDLDVSGVAPVTGAFTATGNGAVFTPAAGRPFNLTVYATGGTAPGSALNATVYLARSIDGGTTYLPITATGAQLFSFTTVANESLYETQTGVTYRLICTLYTSGTVNYRFAQ